jgi:hypothetical protein
MDPKHVDFLLKNGMVGVGGDGGKYKSFAEAYERIQKSNELPTFITSDCVLDAYHHIFEGILLELEENDFIDNAKEMARKVMEASDVQRDSLAPEHRGLAEQNVVYFGVALRILDPTAEVPAYAVDDIDTILTSIVNAQGFLAIPGFHQREDFTQYKPRGHYTRSDELTAYFKTMMWFGRITFQGKYVDETRRAVLVASAMRNDEDAMDAYTSISQVIDFMVGAPDDLTPLEVMETSDVVLGPLDPSFSAIFDDEKLDELTTSLKELRPPKINSDVVLPGEEVWGMRVFGQRYVPDSYIFQECVFSKVPNRFMPTCLDVMAVLGSEEAWEREDLDTSAPKLEQQLTKLSNEFEGYPDHTWNSTLYWAWLHTIKSLDETPAQENAPAFMQTRAWSAKDLNTQAASWTQLTHDTVLYRKQSYTIRLCIPQPSDIIYVEPVPELYSRLGDMVRATERGLEYLEMGSERIFDKLERFEGTLEMLERMAVNELEGRGHAQDDINAVRRFYSTLETLNRMGDDEEDTKTVLVSDVHTDPNSYRCLQEGVGYVRLMVVVVSTTHGTFATVGAVFEHYEFTQDLSAGRLTDEEWAKMLDEGTAPEPAPWARDFIL